MKRQEDEDLAMFLVFCAQGKEKRLQVCWQLQVCCRYSRAPEEQLVSLLSREMRYK